MFPSYNKKSIQIYKRESWGDMHKFFLIRHGESQSNAGLATADPGDVELTPRGHEQARQIAAFLKEYTALNLIVTSAYLRTKQTAAPTKAIFHATSMEEWEVQEFTYLSSAYLGYSTSNDRRPLVDAYWEQCNPSYTDGRGSESFKVFIGRVEGFIRQLKNRRENIAIFSHEQFLAAVLWVLQKRPTVITSDTMQDFRDFFNRNRIPNGAIVEITVRRGQDSQDVWIHKQIKEHLERPRPESESLLARLSRGSTALVL
jgi:2,3-bisphosphoglycerate-dependent phosphoglycerate mutase